MARIEQPAKMVGVYKVATHGRYRNLSRCSS
jgi:hypothetical protein